MKIHHNVYELLEELNRLVQFSPAAVGAVLRRLVDKGGAAHDCQERIKTLILSLADRGEKDNVCKAHRSEDVDGSGREKSAGLASQVAHWLKAESCLRAQKKKAAASAIKGYR